MKILFFLLLFPSIALASDDPVWLCSEKLNMFFYGGAKTKSGFFSYVGNDAVKLSFDIDNVDLVSVYPVKHNNDQCDRADLKLGLKSHIRFYKPFNGRKVDITVNKQKLGFFTDKKRNYILAVRNKEKDKVTHYYKIFTFVDDLTQY